MYIPFNKISDSARSWIFASEKELAPSEKEIAELTLSRFTSQWQSHQKDVLSSFNILENRFIVIAADQDFSDISGCGIDKAMHIILELEQVLQCALTNKSLLFFRKNDHIQTVKLQNFKQVVAGNQITREDLYYNTLAATVKDIREKFLVPVSQSWLRKYFVDKESKIIL